MVVDFTKMNGAGNDFILLDNRAGEIALTEEQVVRLCHRQRGIGADGLLLLVPCQSGKADWAWSFFNSDGSRAEMCGNGARCFARYVRHLTGTSQPISFETGAGIIRAEFDGDRVSVTLTSPRDLILNQKIPLSHGTECVHFINTGVPHAVVFVPEADKVPVASVGAAIRWHPHFAPKGANANFVQVLAPGHIRVRTYERGVEGETLACGTGVTASALVSSRVHGFRSPIEVQVQGGDRLEVMFEDKGEDFQNVQLKGPAEFVYRGRIKL